MNRLVIFFIVLLLGLTSCGMHKQVMSQDSQTDYNSESHDSVVVSSELQNIIRATVEDMLKSSMTVSIVEDRKVWSSPDTLGNQHVVIEEKITTNMAAKESRTTTTSSSEESIEHVDSSAVSASVEDLVMETSARIVEKRSLPLWQISLMIIGAAAIIYLIIKIALKIYASKGIT